MKAQPALQHGSWALFGLYLVVLKILVQFLAPHCHQAINFTTFDEFKRLFVKLGLEPDA